MQNKDSLLEDDYSNYCGNKIIRSKISKQILKHICNRNTSK